MAGLIDRLSDNLVAEFGLRTNLRESGNVERLEDVLAGQKGLFADFGRLGDVDHILAAEKLILAFEFDYYANSKSMASSLDGAMKDLVAPDKARGAGLGT
jgi:hypothetical protein